MKTRVISAAVLIVITLTCVLLSPITRVVFLAVAGGLCAYEFSKNVEKLEARCTLWVMYVYLAAQALLTLLNAGLFAYAVCFVFCIYLALFSGVIHKTVSGRGALYTLAGLTYPCLLFSVVMVISISGIWSKVFIIGACSAWLCDTFALFGGMCFGKHKLAPLVSPKKTIEGCLCGALFSLLAGVITYFIYRESSFIPMWLCLLTALVSSSMGQIGDLAESLLKRMIGVKDFSNLIPGHGGVFDRVDSLLFSVPTAYFCFYLAGIH